MITTPPQPVMVCDVSRHPDRYFGKMVAVEGLLFDISPHGIFLRDRRDPKCENIQFGTMAGDEDFWDAVSRVKLPPMGKILVRVSGVLRSEERTWSGGRKYRALVVNHASIARATTKLDPVRPVAR